MVSAVATAPSADDVVAYWALEDLTDETSTYTLTNSGASSGATGILDDAYDWDGTNDFVYADDNDGLTFTNKIVSFNAWIKSSASNGVILYKGSSTSNREYALLLSPDGKVQCVLHNLGSGTGSNMAETPLTYIDGNFHMVTCTMDGSNIRLYIDNSLKDTESITASSGNYASDLFIGKYGGNALYFDGVIDEIAIFDVALSADEIEYLYASGSPSSAQQYPFSSGESPSFSVSAVDFWDNTSINSFWADIDGTNYTTSNGTIKTTLYQNDTNTYTLTVGATDRITETYTNLEVSSNKLAELHQYEVRIIPVEYLTSRVLLPNSYNITWTVDNRTNQSVVNLTGSPPTYYGDFAVFYLNGGSHTAQINITGYYPYEYTWSSFPGPEPSGLTAINAFGAYNNILTFNVKDVITGDIINKNSTVYIQGTSDSGGTLSVQTLNLTNGTITTNFIQGVYNLTIVVDDYAYYYANITIDNLTEVFNYSLYANNSVWITAKSALNGATLTNFSVSIYDLNNSYEGNDSNTGIIRLNNITSGIYTAVISKNGYDSAEYPLTITGGSHQNLIAYLSSGTTTTIFSVQDLISTGLIEGASANQYKIINSTWTLVSSQETDLTGRVQFSYTPNTEYKFIISKDGYTTRNFFLTPLFSTYTIRLTPELTENTDFNTGNFDYFISKNEFQADNWTNLSIGITSGTGTIINFTINITSTAFTSQTTYTYTCTNAYGCSYDINEGLWEATPYDENIEVSYTIYETGRAAKSFKYLYPIIGTYKDYTLQSWKDQDDTTGVGDLEKGLIATLILLVVIGGIATAASFIGAPPLTTSGIALVVLIIVLATVGFVPNYVAYVVGFGGLLMAIFGRGEY
jgi:Flp pilus assembly pilin Flp